jgi:hypothetical protein
MSTIYVANSGNNSNAGTSKESAFQTINYASEVALNDPAVDTIYIESGSYNETIVPPRDGLTYTGELDQNGNPRTIIDPSMSLTQQWEKVTDTWVDGANIWRVPLGYEPKMFIRLGQCIPCLGKKPAIDPNFGISLSRQERLNILAIKYDPGDPPQVKTTVRVGGPNGQDVRFWDVPYALAAYDVDSGWTYIRFRDESISPNLPNLRAVVGGPNPTYAINISNISNTTISNLLIQGAYIGIHISAGLKGGHHNTVRNCYMQHGLNRILIEGEQGPGLTNNCHDNDISLNTFRLNMYGYASPGNYQAASQTYDLAIKEWFYLFLKYVVGDTSTADIAIVMRVCGANNRIHHNTFENGGEGVFIYLCDNAQIYSNTFQQLSDCGVLASDFAQLYQPSVPSGETVQNNTFIDVTLCVRYDRIDVADGVTTNYHYFLCNTDGKGANCGAIFEFHMQYDGSPPSPPSTVGKFALTAAGNKFGATFAVLSLSGYTTARGGIPAVNILSNSFLSRQTLYYRGTADDRKTFKARCAMIGSFVSNRVVDDMAEPVPPVWYGVSNTKISS